MARKKDDIKVLQTLGMGFVILFLISLPFAGCSFVVDKVFGTHWITRDASCEQPLDDAATSSFDEDYPEGLYEALADHYGSDTLREDKLVMAWPERALVLEDNESDEWWRLSDGVWQYDDKCSEAVYNPKVTEPRPPLF